jgi:predicted lipoprotein with Yx(FWY)xxD motif
MKSPFYFILLLSVLLLQACSEDEPNPEPISTPMVKLTNVSGLGEILTDENGLALYFFTRDAENESNCEGNCINNWPIFHIENLEIEGNLLSADFGNIIRGDGKKQTTYKGWPLYYFNGDANPGDINGEGVNNVWFVAKEDYSIFLVDHQLTGHDGKKYKGDYSEGEEVVQYMVDDRGRTLYGFIRDRINTNNFTKADFSNDAVWPIFEGGIRSVPSNLDRTLFGEIEVFGKKQTTYNGWPLYYFGQDEMVKGSNKGISFPAPGVWPIITPDINMPPSPETILLKEHELFGKILTDAEGNTLYFFTRDVVESSNCSGNCIINWPVFYTEDVIFSGDLDSEDFNEIERNDGSRQTTYKGWPLYYFNNDNNPGEVNGEAVGNVWYVAKPDYSVMLVNAQLIGHDGIEYTGSYAPGQEVVQYMVDDYGRTLYGFINDKFDKNNFTKSDFSNDAVWPIYQQEKLSFPSQIDGSLFNVIDVHGRFQLTYKGWPLYYFGQDQMIRGSNKGISFPAPGVWPVVSIDINTAPL